jgi:hypothetical protein
VANGARPLLSYGAKGTRVGRKTFLFAQALRQWESLHSQMDLSEAYKRAKQNFAGKMEQMFVVLKEDVDVTGVASGSNQVPIGNKRKNDEEIGNQAKKN